MGTDEARPTDPSGDPEPNSGQGWSRLWPLIAGGALVIAWRAGLLHVDRTAHQSVNQVAHDLVRRQLDPPQSHPEAGLAVDRTLQSDASRAITAVPLPDQRHARRSAIHVDNDYGFLIQMPDGWTVGSGRFAGNIPVKAMKRGRDSERISLQVHVMDVDGPRIAAMTASQLFQHAYASEGTLLAAGSEVIHSAETKWMEMRLHTMSGRAIGYAFIRGDQLFWLYAIALGGNDSWFDQNKADVLEAIRTFRFI